MTIFHVKMSAPSMLFSKKPIHMSDVHTVWVRNNSVCINNAKHADKSHDRFHVSSLIICCDTLFSARSRGGEEEGGSGAETECVQTAEERGGRGAAIINTGVSLIQVRVRAN